MKIQNSLKGSRKNERQNKMSNYIHKKVESENVGMLKRIIERLKSISKSTIDRGIIDNRFKKLFKCWKLRKRFRHAPVKM